MLASDVGIEMLAILSHENAYNSVDLLSSEDVAVVVDFHWFTDCHLEAIFYMNSSRLRLDLRDHRRRERCSSDHRRFSLNPARHDILPHRQSQPIRNSHILHIYAPYMDICGKYVSYMFSCMSYESICVVTYMDICAEC